ncbi:hypothetical protein VOLCADRAFT_104198 [Volvox carteri f. nagariensis]|uniref:Uncharacterized protein n=1 Tax=Volvox carteri f. nagariensis TaxID=3068 RepID=D8TS28_VOLCA|nr:uncharacterized protein VOLCADRAFT_104198 [Volvox carteri f. nagariensis]EFJ49620.1 hypothetical protein VOLCADRAFT_104198 [Volvox carteri f. nagariensis]|eukprot:XP_002949127.1 hypothetical protein VOLCADRAFT_104198 [Volvox carteri f. nagariensis]
MFPLVPGGLPWGQDPPTSPPHRFVTVTPVRDDLIVLPLHLPLVFPGNALPAMPPLAAGPICLPRSAPLPLDPVAALYYSEFTGDVSVRPPLTAALLSIYQVHQRQWVSESWRRVQSAAREFHGWLQRQSLGLTLLTCDPMSIVSYLVEWWFPRHPGCLQADGRPSASAVKGVISSLATAFKQLGREGDYDASQSRGNPCDSSLGVSDEDLMRSTHIRSLGTLHRYLDPTRHLARLPAGGTGTGLVVSESDDE